MTTTIVIIGRANVGKSTLFNRLTGSRTALVVDQPGVTRDIQYGTGTFGERTFTFIDTGGLLDPGEHNRDITGFVSEQSLRAAREADAAFWLVDGRDGLTATDEILAHSLRKDCRHLYLLVNKTDGLDVPGACAEFHALGVGEPLPISARQGSGIHDIMAAVIQDIPDSESMGAHIPARLRICFIGRPNAGKSTLINRILGAQRMLTHAAPGTPRDSIATPFTRNDRDYVLVDTAGVRRRSRITETVEKFSVVKTLEAINKSQVIIVVMDAREEIAEQDLNLVGMAAGAGKPLIIVVNKWDGLDAEQKTRITAQIDRRLKFADYAQVQYISALHGTGVGELFTAVERIGKAIARQIQAARLTEILRDAVAAHPPPLVHGRRIKLRYAHIGGLNPLRIVVHGNQTEHVPEAYRRYLAGAVRTRLKLTGTPVLIEFRSGENPYQGKRNILTRRQLTKRRRIRKV